jgi:hypothetical protein
MVDIEPWHGWRNDYISERDEFSPFYKKKYDNSRASSKIYNYYIHPQWDFFGSETLYIKILYVNYKQSFAMFELIGEWNDGIGNDIMFLKRDIADLFIKKGISKFILFCDNVLNYHGDDDSYYEEWYDDIKDENGFICLVNTFDHVHDEMNKYRLYYYLNYGPNLNDINWRLRKPKHVLIEIENILSNQQKSLT